MLIRLFFEATRDAGLWNVHWSITDQPPNSDNVWRQWRAINTPSFREPTATAECDELSALFAFLAERAGVRNVGLFWPASDQAAREALGRRASFATGAAEDASALQTFANEMRVELLQG